MVASWLHAVKFRAGAKVEDVPIEVLGLPLRAEVARRDAETVLVEGDFGRGQRWKIMELDDCVLERPSS